MFTSVVPYRLRRTLDNRTTAYFSDCEHDYVVYIDPDVVDERFWDVAFCASTYDGCLIDEGLTGAQNARSVLSTVVAVIRDHQSRFGSRPLRLMAADAKRRRVYHRMAQKLLPDWLIHVAGNNVMALPVSFFTETHGPHR